MSHNFLNGSLSGLCANLANLLEVKLDGEPTISPHPCTLTQPGSWPPLLAYFSCCLWGGADNQLTELPPQVGSWERLQYFSAANNELTSLPYEVSSYGVVMLLLAFVVREDCRAAVAIAQS